MNVVATLAALSSAAALVIGSPTTADAATPTCQGRPATVQATSTDGYTSNYLGTPGDDVIVVDRTASAVRAGDGNDLICVRAKVGAIDTGAGDDMVDARQQSAQVDLGPGSDTYLGGDGADTVSTGVETAVGPDHDVVQTGNGPDKVVAQSADDDVSTGAGRDVVVLGYTGKGAGSLELGRAVDAINIRTPDLDALVDYRGGRVMVSAARYSVVGAESAMVVAQRAHLVGDSHRNVFNAFTCDAKILGGAGDDQLTTITGDFASPPIRLSCGSHIEARLIGGPGNDDLRGRRGRTTMIGGPGFDRASGAGGDDTCYAERTTHCHG